MPIVLLIRHGENEYARRGVLAGRLHGVHLNEKGRIQAQELAEALTKMPIRAVYSSPLERATETAACRSQPAAPAGTQGSGADRK